MPEFQSKKSGLPGSPEASRSSEQMVPLALNQQLTSGEDSCVRGMEALPRIPGVDPGETSGNKPSWWRAAGWDENSVFIYLWAAPQGTQALQVPDHVKPAMLSSFVSVSPTSRRRWCSPSLLKQINVGWKFWEHEFVHPRITHMFPLVSVLDGKCPSTGFLPCWSEKLGAVVSESFVAARAEAWCLQ